MAEIDRRISKSRGYRKQTLLRVMMVTSIGAFLFIASLSLLIAPSSDFSAVPVPSGISYTSHVTISINGNAQFNNTNYPNNGVVSGNGTASNPYIIEGWDISAASANGIMIQNTNAYFIVRDCYVHGGGSMWRGFYLYIVSNGKVSNNTCSNNFISIDIYTSSGNIVSNNTCSGSDYGIALGSSNHIIVCNNTCSSNDYYGISIASSTSNTISNNTCSNSWYGMDLHLSSTSNSLIFNTLESNSRNGLWITTSSSNIIAWNRMCNNTNQGVYIASGSGNMIWNNTFINNNGAGVQASDDGTNNRWNTSGSPHGFGNFWDDLTSPDVAPIDGIVDWSYNLTGTAGAKDFYPQTTAPIIPEPPIILLIPLMIGAFLLISTRNRKKK